MQGDICSICCGTEREVTINCPLDCTYLREARSREKLPDVDPSRFPNADIRIGEDFLRRNEPLLIVVAASLATAALETDGVVDSDVREAIDALVRTYRTLQSGLYYESRPDNILAAQVQRDVQESIDDLRRRAEEEATSIRDSEVLGILAFLQRLGIQHDNGRPKGRTFIDFLQQFFPAEEPEGGLITTG